MAHKISPGGGGSEDDKPHVHPAGQGRWRQPPARPTRAPHGEVLWWERPAPESSDEALWRAVQRIHVRRQQLGISVTELARRLEGRGFPMRRETLSRVLNGKQPTTWSTAERLADIVGISLADPDPDSDTGTP